MSSLSLARSNLFVCKSLLEAFTAKGLEYLILCPGSRSGALALAAEGVSRTLELNILTAIDERSAAFLALGISTASGKATAVVTTSGTAVANLLPAAVEADRSCQPLLFLTADRPYRLKNCGANQTVNQEDFLLSVCRHNESGPKKGLHLISQNDLINLVDVTWSKAHKQPGPVHINLPFEEPLYPSLLEQNEIWEGWKPEGYKQFCQTTEIKKYPNKSIYEDFPSLDPFRPGVIIVGPWRGHPNNFLAFKEALIEWQKRSGWPIFADPLSGLNTEDSGLIFYWELLLSAGILDDYQKIQVLRLGPLPASRKLESWIKKLGKEQVLVTEGESRGLDPIGIAEQWNNGFAAWMEVYIRSQDLNSFSNNKEVINLINNLKKSDLLIKGLIKTKLSLRGNITEPSLAHWLPRLIPSKLPVMLSASSPIRDWMTYSGEACFSRRCFSFRGASGIDGTLSLAMGLSVVKGKLFLVTGDLALLHDTNGWLFSHNEFSNLIVILIDNGGGGIFRQLEIDDLYKGDFEKIFIMPQKVSSLKLVEAYGVLSRQVSSLEDLGAAIEWSVSISRTVMIRICTNSCEDNELRKNLRNEVIKLLKSC